MSGSGSAWSRPLNNRGRFSNDGGSGRNNAASNNSSNSGGGVAGQGQRPPPGIGTEGGGGGGGSTRFGGWGNRSSVGGGGVGNSTNNNGHSKKVTTSNNTATTTNAATLLSNSQQQQEEQIILRERFIHLILSMVGHTVTLTTTNNQILEGVFHTFTPFDSLHDEGMKNKYVIKACRTIQKGENGATNNGDKDIAMEEGGTLVIPSYRVASVQVKSMRLDNSNVMMSNNGSSSAAAASMEKTSASEGGADTSTFQTDSQISGGRGGNHTLVAAGSVWTSAGDGSDLLSLGKVMVSTPNGGKKGADSLNWRAAAARGGISALSSSSTTKSSSAPSTGSGGIGGGGGALDGSIGDWDQFSANERKFNVKASFDENLYTTKLDVSNIDTAKIAEAERIAREIEGTVSSNIHIAEERNQAIQTDYDEEDLYSGVLTKDLKARTIKVVPDVPSSTDAAISTTSTSTTATTTNLVEEKKKGVATVGKVMNYAQAAAKKGLAEKMLKPPAASAASPAPASTTDAKAAISPSTSKNAQLATLSEDKTSAEKTVAHEVAAEKASGPYTEAKLSDDGENDMEGEATKDEKSEEAAAPATDSASKLKLNPNAKSFTFNPTAKSFTPSFTAPATSVSPMPPMQPPPPPSMDTHMMMPPQPHPHGDYPLGPPMMGMGMGGPQFAPMHGMMPMMNPQHQHMRQQYPPPYGQQPMPPMPPQHQGVAASPPPGQEDSASVTTGEGSETPAVQQPLQPPPPYMQQPGSYGGVPPGGYPGYHYGQMPPPGRGGPSPPGTGGGSVYQGPPQMHHHPHMQVMPGIVPYGAPPPRMYPQSQHMMQQNPQHMGLPSHAAAGMMYRGGPPPPYYGVGVPSGGPPMGYGGGYPPQPHGGVGGGNLDQDEHGYRNRNSGSMPPGGRGGGGGGGGMSGGRGNRGNKNNRKFGGRGPGGRGFHHQNSLDSESNDASPGAESGGDGHASGGSGGVEVDVPVHSEVSVPDKKVSNDETQ